MDTPGWGWRRRVAKKCSMAIFFAYVWRCYFYLALELWMPPSKVIQLLAFLTFPHSTEPNLFNNFWWRHLFFKRTVGITSLMYGENVCYWTLVHSSHIWRVIKILPATVWLGQDYDGGKKFSYRKFFTHALKKSKV